MTGSPRSTFAFHRVAWSLLAALAIAVAGLAAPALTRAQDLEGATESYYAYVSPDASTMMLLAHLEPDDPDLAGDLVSPQFADDFFEGFTLLTDYDFAHDVGPARIAQIEDADEYMVFDGMLDFTVGIEPGYVIFLSAAQQVFVVAGYQEDADAVFGLAEQAIEEGEPPVEFEDFERLDLTEDVEADQSAADEPASDPSPFDRLGGSDDDTGDEDNGGESGSDDNRGGEDDGELICIDDPGVAVFDTDGDGVVSLTELQEFSDIPEIVSLLDQLEASGVTGIEYSGC